MTTKRKILLGVAMAVLVIAGGLTIFGEALLSSLGHWLEVRTPLGPADIVVALGGDRTRQDEAVRLLQEGVAAQVLFVGSDVRERDYHCLHVPPGKAIPPLKPADTTIEEAGVTRALVEQRGLRSVLIVTSPHHLRRAVWTFTQVFEGTHVALFAAPAPNRAFSLDTWWRNHVGRKSVLSEYAALIFYWLTV